MTLQRRSPDVRLDVVCVTDGEASHAGSVRVTPARLASRRRREAAVADRRLGVTTRRRWLAVPDGAVRDHEARLADELAVLLDDPPTALCVAPWMGDGHPDHEATGRAACEAAARTATPLLAYPVWAWHWAVPGSGDLPLGGARRLTLDADQVRRKAAAIGAHRSQVRPLGPDPADGPILTSGVLTHFRRPFEVFLR
jgi:LmbE family N-acetylglucosaminyl deacetylase